MGHLFISLSSFCAFVFSLWYNQIWTEKKKLSLLEFSVILSTCLYLFRYFLASNNIFPKTSSAAIQSYKINSIL